MVNPRLAFLVPTSFWHGHSRGGDCLVDTRGIRNVYTPPLLRAAECDDGSDSQLEAVRHVPDLPPPAQLSSRKAILSSEEIDPARTSIFALLHEHFAAQCLYTVVNLGVPDVLGEETLTVREIADRIGNSNIDRDLLFRQLRLLSETGGVADLFVESAAGEEGSEFAYSLGMAGKLLQTDVGGGQPSFACAIQHSFEPPFWLAWSKLAGATYSPSGVVPFEQANGKNIFDYYQSHPESMAPFQEFMAANSAGAIAGMVEGYDWSKLEGKRVCDVGGGLGEVMTAVKEKYAGIEAMSMDLAPVIDMIPVEPKGVELIRGDMFDSSTIPPECDVVLLRHILHDWSSEDCGRILRSMYEALPDHGELLIVDAVLPGPGVTGPLHKVQKQVDMLMAMVGGQERTLDQLTALMTANGWKIDTVVENTPSLNLDGVITCSKILE